MAKPNAAAIRDTLEQREHGILRPEAAFADGSRGRARPEEEHPYRTCFQRDRDRIVHSKAFRRLKRKTQVFLSTQGDHYRTRLTHTLEVAQIARTVARALFLNEDLVEAIALGHDLGHTPFGHAGEAVLNELHPGGFNHAEQSLRIVEKLEPSRMGHGLNLTYEVLEGIRHHSRAKTVLTGDPNPPGATLEGVVVSVCDAIAYINHDIDDAILNGVIGLEDLPQDALDCLGRTSSDRINAMAGALIEGSTDAPAITMTPEIREATWALRKFLYSQLYPCQSIRVEIAKGERIVRELYGFFMEHPELLDSDPWAVPLDVPAAPPPHHDDPLERRVADMVAGMTDSYALALYQRHFFPISWRL